MQIRASFKDIWQLAYPIIIGSLAQNLIGIVDVIFLGRVGETELGACGLISIYYLVLMMIGFGISRGGQILIARRTGQKKYEDVGIIAYNLFYLEMLTAVLIFIFLCTISPWVLTLFISSNEIYQASIEYLDYRKFGIFFSLFGFVLMGLYTGIGRTKIIALVTGVLFFTNTILNYGLIFGELGMPKMGIAGAGLASTYAEIVSTVFGISYIVADKQLIKFSIRKYHPPNFNVLKRLTTLATPMVLQYLVGLGGWFMLFSLIESMGKRALSVSTVIKNVYTFYSIPAWGFASAANAVVSNILGQGKFKQVLIAINKTAILSFIFTVVPCLLLMLFPGTILSLFTTDPEVIAEALPILAILIAILVACSIATVIFNGVLGTGATTLAMCIEIVAVIIYLSYAYGVVRWMNLGLTYVWASEFLYWVVLATFSFLFLQFGKWKNLDV